MKCYQFLNFSSEFIAYYGLTVGYQSIRCPSSFCSSVHLKFFQAIFLYFHHYGMMETLDCPTIPSHTCLYKYICPCLQACLIKPWVFQTYAILDRLPKFMGSCVPLSDSITEEFLASFGWSDVIVSLSNYHSDLTSTSIYFLKHHFPFPSEISLEVCMELLWFIILLTWKTFSSHALRLACYIFNVFFEIVVLFLRTCLKKFSSWYNYYSGSYKWWLLIRSVSNMLWADAWSNSTANYCCWLMLSLLKHYSNFLYVYLFVIMLNGECFLCRPTKNCFCLFWILSSSFMNIISGS